MTGLTPYLLTGEPKLLAIARDSLPLVVFTEKLHDIKLVHLYTRGTENVVGVARPRKALDKGPFSIIPFLVVVPLSRSWNTEDSW